MADSSKAKKQDKASKAEPSEGKAASKASSKSSSKASNGVANGTGRVAVSKTYKLYIGGGFVRSERGRYLPAHDSEGRFVANYAWATRKDFRNAMVVARKAQGGWAKRSAFNRSQIIFRLAEMLEDRRSLFEAQLCKLAGYTPEDAAAEVDVAVDRVFWYAGWSDKFSQVLGGINPVASPFFNFTLPEPTGVVTIFAPTHAPLLGLVSAIAPVILSGNTCIAIVENDAPTIAIDLAEAIATSDFPGGVINILTGQRAELISHVANHMDLNAIACYGGEKDQIIAIQTAAAQNVKRVEVYDDPDASAWREESMQSLYRISPYIEWKTAWHPIGI